MQTTGTRRSDQGAVWEEIHAKAARMDADSPTHAMAEVFERHAVSVENYVRAFSCEEGQAGVGFAIAGRACGFDLFDHPSTLRRLFPKLPRSYALDALEHDQGATPPEAGAFEEMLRRAAGLGKDIRLEGEGIAGAALWEGSRYVHTCAFRTRNSAAGLQTRISRPRRRASR